MARDLSNCHGSKHSQLFVMIPQGLCLSRYIRHFFVFICSCFCGSGGFVREADGRVLEARMISRTPKLCFRVVHVRCKFVLVATEDDLFDVLHFEPIFSDACVYDDGDV